MYLTVNVNSNITIRDFMILILFEIIGHYDNYYLICIYFHSQFSLNIDD